MHKDINLIYIEINSYKEYLHNAISTAVIP